MRLYTENERLDSMFWANVIFQGSRCADIRGRLSWGAIHERNQLTGFGTVLTRQVLAGILGSKAGTMRQTELSGPPLWRPSQTFSCFLRGNLMTQFSISMQIRFYSVSLTLFVSNGD